MRLAFPFSRPATAYEPARIYLAPEYIFLENIFSPLVEISTTGKLEPGIAETYEWKNNEARFQIRKNSKTIDGKEVTAHDVEFSLKLLVVLAGSTHGQLGGILCGSTQLKKIDAPCPGIEVRGDTVVLKTLGYRPFLMPMLASIDFAIIPRSSVDPATLAIRDYRNTSGPYFVETDDLKGNIVLKANPNHYHFSQQIPDQIELIPTANTSSIELFRDNKIDFITTVDALRPEEVIAF